MSPISDIGAFRNGRWQLDDFLERHPSGRCSWSSSAGPCSTFSRIHPAWASSIRSFKTIDLICDLVEQSNGAAEIVSLDVNRQARHAH